MLLAGCALAEDSYFRAKAAFEAGQFEAALGWIGKLAPEEASRPAAQNLKSLALAELGRYPEALEASARARELDPQNQHYIYNAALILMSKGELAEAEQTFGRALERFPRSTVLHNGLGETLLRLNRFEDAEQALRKSVEIDPGAAQAQVLLARLYYALGERGKLGQAAARALERAPNDHQACYYYGLWLMDYEHREQEGAAWVEKSIQMAPQFVDGLKSWGQWLARRNQWREAAKAFERARSLAPRDAQLVYLLATAERKAGNRAAADELLKRYRGLAR